MFWVSKDSNCSALTLNSWFTCERSPIVNDVPVVLKHSTARAVCVSTVDFIGILKHLPKKKKKSRSIELCEFFFSFFIAHATNHLQFFEWGHVTRLNSRLGSACLQSHKSLCWCSRRTDSFWILLLIFF